MKTTLASAPRIAAVAALLGAVACGGDESPASQETNASPETGEGAASAEPQGSGQTPQRLQIDQPAVSVQVPAPPTFELAIEQNGEYQIDVEGAPMDPEAYLYRGDELVEHNDDGGEGLNARIVRFLDPGTYSVRVVEHRARPFSAQVSVQKLSPLEPSGEVTLGEPLTVEFPEVPLRDRPDDDRSAAKAVALEVTEAGSYTCTASADNARDPKMALIHDGQILEEDDDSGDGNDASISRQLEPGTYSLRVWDWSRRGDMHITVTCNRG